MNGRWVNVDPNTRSLVEIGIDGLKIHPYGSCHPTACDWGIIQGKSIGKNVRPSAPTALVARKITNFDWTEIRLSLASDGKLRAELFTHFTDHSGRADRRTVDLFTRSRAPVVP